MTPKPRAERVESVSQTTEPPGRPMEIFGPSRAYFEVSDGGVTVRRVYRTLRAPNSEMLMELIELIREALNSEDVIFWRRKPVPGDPYCRLITSRPLPDELWKKAGWDTTGTGVSPP